MVRDDIAYNLALFAADTRFEMLSPGVIATAKKSLLDTLGVMLAASGMEPAALPIRDLMRENGGRPEATVIGYGGRLPASSAAFINGALAHGLDFDSQTPWGAHPDSSVIPTVLALAEKRGTTTGPDLIRAIAVGQEIFIRLRRNVGWHMDWNLSTALGCFSAAAAGGAVMGLDHETIAHALGIASMQSSGTMELIFGTGSDLRGMYAGFTSQSSVNAVLLAQRGMTGIPRLFEGEAGLFRVYFNGEYDRAAMLKDLGRHFQSEGMIYKYWPAVGNAHTYIHAAIELACKGEFNHTDVEEIRVYCGDFAMRMCTPLGVRQVPQTLVDAKFSLPFLLALALTRRGMQIADFTEASLKDPAVLELARKVTPVGDPAFNWTQKLPHGKIEIRLQDGRTLEKIGVDVPGTPECPLSWEQLVRKFAECARAAATPLPTDESAAFSEKIASLEAMCSGGVSELLALLSRNETGDVE